MLWVRHIPGPKYDGEMLQLQTSSSAWENSGVDKMEKNSAKEVTDKAEAVLIRQYKKLLSEMDHNEEELKQSDNQHVVGHMKDVQLLFAQIKSPKPLCLDAKVTFRVAGIIREQGHQMSSNIINYNLEEYTAWILRKLDVEPGIKLRSRSFVKFGRIISTKFGRSPALTFLYGAVPSQPAETEKEKPLRRERAREPKTALKETCTLDINQNRNNTGQLDGTEKMVEKAMGCLVRQFKKNGRQPVDYFQFILDPESFSKTIENMFHVSFLVNIPLPSFPSLFFHFKNHISR